MSTTRIRLMLITALALVIGVLTSACEPLGGAASKPEATSVPVAAGEVDLATCRELFDSTPAISNGPSVVVVMDATRSATAPKLSSEAATVILETAKAKGTVTILGVNGAGAAPVVVAKDATLYPDGLSEDTPREDRILAIAPGCVAAIGATATPTKPGSDIMAAYQDATSFTEGHPASSLIINTDGLANAGTLSLNEISPNADAKTIVGKLEAAGVLPRTKAKTIISGLGATAGQRVDAPQRERLDAMYLAICEATGAASCTIGSFAGAADAVVNTKAPEDPPVQLGTSPTIVIDSAANSCNLDLPEGLAFDADSYALRRGAEEAIAPVVASLSAHPSARVTVIGHTATASPDKDRLRRFSLKRAEAVAGLLREASIGSDRITVKGVGDSDQKVNDVVNGHLVDELAQVNRRVELKVEGAVC